MNVAVFHNLPSGGALVALRETVAAFKRAGFQVGLFAFTTAEDRFVGLSALADVSHGEPLEFRGFGRFERYERASRNLAERIDRWKADVVWVDKCRFLGTPSVLKYLRSREKTLFYAHEPLRYARYEALAPSAASGSGRKFFPDPQKVWRARAHFETLARDRGNMRFAPRVLTNSRFTSKWLSRCYGVSAEVLYQGVDTGFFSPAPSGQAASGAAPRLLSVGRLDASKGHDFVLSALSRIAANERPAWTIVADSADEAYAARLSSMSKRVGVRYDLKSGISFAELRDLYRSSFAVACASRNEPFGRVPLEAMACGTPVLAVDEGGFTETVRPEAGGRLLSRNADEWAGALRRYLADPAAARLEGLKARSHVLREWASERFEKELKALIEDMI